MRVFACRLRPGTNLIGAGGRAVLSVTMFCQIYLVAMRCTTTRSFGHYQIDEQLLRDSFRALKWPLISPQYCANSAASDTEAHLAMNVPCCQDALMSKHVDCHSENLPLADVTIRAGADFAVMDKDF